MPPAKAKSISMIENRVFWGYQGEARERGEMLGMAKNRVVSLMGCMATKGSAGADCDQQAQNLRGGVLLIEQGIYPEDIKRRQAQIICPIIIRTKYGGM